MIHPIECLGKINELGSDGSPSIDSRASLAQTSDQGMTSGSTRRAPNWLGSSDQRPTMDSKTFARVDNSDIGWRSVSIDLGGFTLGIGITSADFYNYRNVRCIRDKLNMAKTISASEEANS